MCIRQQERQAIFLLLESMIDSTNTVLLLYFLGMEDEIVKRTDKILDFRMFII